MSHSALKFNSVRFARRTGASTGAAKRSAAARKMIQARIRPSALKTKDKSIRRDVISGLCEKWFNNEDDLTDLLTRSPGYILDVLSHIGNELDEAEEALGIGFEAPQRVEANAEGIFQQLKPFQVEFLGRVLSNCEANIDTNQRSRDLAYKTLVICCDFSVIEGNRDLFSDAKYLNALKPYISLADEPHTVDKRNLMFSALSVLGNIITTSKAKDFLIETDTLERCHTNIVNFTPKEMHRQRNIVVSSINSFYNLIVVSNFELAQDLALTIVMNRLKLREALITCLEHHDRMPKAERDVNQGEAALKTLARLPLLDYSPATYPGLMTMAVKHMSESNDEFILESAKILFKANFKLIPNGEFKAERSDILVFALRSMILNVKPLIIRTSQNLSKTPAEIQKFRDDIPKSIVVHRINGLLDILKDMSEYDGFKDGVLAINGFELINSITKYENYFFTKAFDLVENMLGEESELEPEQKTALRTTTLKTLDMLCQSPNAEIKTNAEVMLQKFYTEDVTDLKTMLDDKVSDINEFLRFYLGLLNENQELRMQLTSERVSDAALFVIEDETSGEEARVISYLCIQELCHVQVANKDLLHKKILAKLYTRYTKPDTSVDEKGLIKGCLEAFSDPFLIAPESGPLKVTEIVSSYLAKIMLYGPRIQNLDAVMTHLVSLRQDYDEYCEPLGMDELLLDIETDYEESDTHFTDVLKCSRLKTVEAELARIVPDQGEDEPVSGTSGGAAKEIKKKKKKKRKKRKKKKPAAKPKHRTATEAGLKPAGVSK